MAVSFVQQPTNPNGTQATVVYSLTGLSLSDQAKYICDVKVSGSATTLVRIKQPSNEYNFGVFELSDVLHDYTDWDEVWKTEQIVTSSNNNTRTFSIEFGEEYGTSPSSSVTSYPSQITSSLTVYPAVEEQIDGLNWDSGSYFNNYLTNSPSTLWARPGDYGTLSHFNLSNSYLTSYRVTIYNQAGSILAQKFFTSTYQGQHQQSEGARLIHLPAGPKNFVNDATLGSILAGTSWSYYTLIANVNEGSKTVYRLDDCIQENGTRFGFINKVGVWDYYTATLTKGESQSFVQDTYEQEFVNFSTSNGDVSFNPSRRGTTIYNKQTTQTLSAQTDWLTTEESAWLLELFQSPSVYVQYGDEFVPIIVTNTEVNKKTNPRGQKLFTYRIEYQYANKPKSRR